MMYLFDTHTFLWFDHTPAKLSATVAEICKASERPLYLSTASIWEVQIKVGLGKLRLPRQWSVLVEEQLQEHSRLLPITLDHIY